MTLQHRLGDITIDRIIEQQAPLFEPSFFFPALTPEVLEENRSWLEPIYLDPKTGRVVLCIQSYLIRTPHHTILVDTCVGNDKPRPMRRSWNQITSDRFQTNLAATGVSVEEIDYVMCTHLHVDHVGWNTRLDNGRWVPTFPKAKYLFSDRELAFWTQRHKDEPEGVPWITDSVLPVIAAGRAEIVKSDHALDDLVQLMPTPGHTIDHYSVKVGKSGADAIITGDMIHSPLQARYPDLAVFVDHDPKQSSESRWKLFRQCCDTPTTICATHFPTPAFGRIARWGDGFKFVCD